MNYILLENDLRNWTFLFLFLNMLFYWVKAAFFYKIKNNQVELFLLLISNFCLMVTLIIRWVDSNHFPLSNLYESLIFLCWGLNLFLFFLQIKIKENYIGILITPIILFINTFATFSLPIEMQKGTSLVPALQSNWLMMHVTIMMLSYTALIFGSLLALAFLFLNFLQTTKNKSLFLIQFDLNTVPKNKDPIQSSPNKLNNDLTYQNIEQYYLESIDNLSYRTLGIGFPLLTIGILSGAIWANETWGSYWSWDPKETWALITWFIYAIYLHSRILKGWKGLKPAFIATFGFLSVWVCYLGVNLFGKGLHSYGWFSFS